MVTPETPTKPLFGPTEFAIAYETLETWKLAALFQVCYIHLNKGL